MLFQNIFQTLNVIAAQENLSTSTLGTAINVAGYHNIGMSVIATTAAASTLVGVLQYSYDNSTWTSTAFQVSVPASQTNVAYTMDIALDQSYWPQIANAGTTGKVYLRIDWTVTGTTTFAYQFVAPHIQAPGAQATNYVYAG